MTYIKLFEQFLGEAAGVKGSEIVKIMKNPKDWGDDMQDRVYTKGNNMIFIDSFYYGEQKALDDITRAWSVGGSYYDYFVNELGIIPSIVNSFSEIRARGRHKKLTEDGVVGVELSFQKIQNESSDLPLDEVVNLVHVYYKDGKMQGTGELVKTKGDKSLIRWDGSNEEWVDSNLVKMVESRKVTLKRRYTENHPAVEVGKIAKIRNKMLEAIGDGKITQEEFDNILKKLSNNGKRWARNNAKYFNISEDGVSLSDSGKKVLKSIIVNEEYEGNMSDLQKNTNTIKSNFIYESFSLFIENELNEDLKEGFDKNKLLKALGKKDDGIILVNGKEYIVYNPNNNNDDNAAMWRDKTVVALSSDGDEHEFKYSDIERFNESLAKDNQEPRGMGTGAVK